MTGKRQPTLLRWMDKVVDGTNGCWRWVGSTYRGGYGHFRRKVAGKWTMYKAHRYSYEVFKGAIPNGHVVRHTCDNPSCVNPAHLLTGTSQDNTDDRKDRGGIPLIRNPRHNNLTMEIARQIRQYSTEHPHEYQYRIADHFHTSKAQVSRILRNEIWAEEN